MGTSSRCGARPSNSAAGRAASRWFWFGLWGEDMAGSGSFDTDAAVADESAGPVEHRLAADAESLRGPVGVDAAEAEIEEGLPRGDGVLQRLALNRVPAVDVGDSSLARQGVDTDAEHVEHRAGNLGEVGVLVLLPVPVRGQLGQAAKAGLAFAQLGGPLEHRLFQLLAVVL